MKLGTSLNLFSRHRLDKTPIPYIEQTRACAEVGFRVLDLPVRLCDELSSDDWEAKIDALGNEAARLGVSFSQAHAPFNNNLFTYDKQPDEDYIKRFNEAMRRCVIASGRLGVKWIVIHPINDTLNTEYDTTIQQKTNIDFYAPALELAKKCGTGLAVENMADFDMKRCKRAYCADTDDLVNLTDAVNDPAFGVCWDFGHARIMIDDQPRQLRRLGDRLKATHVQDTKPNRDSHLIPFVGGNVKWEKIMPTLREINYQGDFILECHSFMNEFPDALRPDAAKLAFDFGMYCLSLGK